MKALKSVKSMLMFLIVLLAAGCSEITEWMPVKGWDSDRHQQAQRDWQPLFVDGELLILDSQPEHAAINLMKPRFDHVDTVYALPARLNDAAVKAAVLSDKLIRVYWLGTSMLDDRSRLMQAYSEDSGKRFYDAGSLEIELGPVVLLGDVKGASEGHCAIIAQTADSSGLSSWMSVLSVDYGRSWSEPLKVADADVYSKPALLFDGGSWHCFLVHTQDASLWQTSLDQDNASWMQPRFTGLVQGDEPVPACSESVISLIYRHIPSGSVLLVRSYDRGESWSQPEMLPLPEAHGEMALSAVDGMLQVAVLGDLPLQLIHLKRQLPGSGKVSGLQVRQDGGGLIQLRWNEQPEALYYRVFRNHNQEGYQFILSARENNCTISAPDSGTTDCFKVSGVFSWGRITDAAMGALSDSVAVSGTIKGQQPNAPDGA